jgi:cell wall-associated NlpC family hydrolase
MHDLDSLIRATTREFAPDPRMAVLDLRLHEQAGTFTITGETTEPAAIAALHHRLSAATGGATIQDEVIRLPDPALGKATFGLVRSAIAPVYADSRIATPQVSQYVLGHRLDLLSRHGHWWRVRGEDGYIGWMHYGYLETGDEEWAQRWERGEDGEPAVSLGAELTDDEGLTFVRLPWGARLVRDQPAAYRLPDGRRGRLGAGELVDADRLRDRFPARGDSIVRSARRWLGTPYLWGGVTPSGADCSGFVQSIFWMHGLALPRDSDQQARVGTGVLEAGEEHLDFSVLRPADLLFFSETEERRISHVAISLGGSAIIHSALSNGEVAVNDLGGPLEVEGRLRTSFVRAHRILPD